MALSIIIIASTPWLSLKGNLDQNDRRTNGSPHGERFKLGISNKQKQNNGHTIGMMRPGRQAIELGAFTRLIAPSRAAPSSVCCIAPQAATTVTAAAAPTLSCTTNAACPLEVEETARNMSNKKPTMNAGPDY